MASEGDAPPAGTAEVLVLGCGVAGLSAALAALEAGIRSITILEARDRVGGRVAAWQPSGTTGASPGVPPCRGFDIGAAWIHGTEGNPLLEWLQFPQQSAAPPSAKAGQGACMEQGLYEVARANPWMHPDSEALLLSAESGGGVATPITVQDAEAAVAAWRGSVLQQAREAGLKCCMEDDVSTTAAAVRDMCADAAAASPGKVAALAWLPHMVELWMGASLGQLQMAEMATTGLWGDFPGPHCLVGAGAPTAPPPQSAWAAWLEAQAPAYGTRRIVRNMLQAIAHVATVEVVLQGDPCCVSKPPDVSEPATLRIELGQTVTAVQWDSVCQCTTSAGRVWSAPHLLCSLPVGVLQSAQVKWSPALPQWKTDALRRIGVGQYCKAVLTFPEATAEAWKTLPPFWGLHELDGTCAKPQQLPPVVYVENYAAMKGQPALVAVWVGQDAACLEDALAGGNVSPEQVVAHAAAAASAVLSSHGHLAEGSTLTPTASTVTGWRHDPYAQGAYSFIPVGGLEDDNDLLGAPVASEEGATIWWAGEACHGEYMGSLHAALLTGQEAGASIGSALASS